MFYSCRAPSPPGAIDSLEKAEFVDGVDGRRWLGEVERREDGFVYFRWAIEAVDVFKTGLLIPSMGNPRAILSGQKAEPTLEIQFVESPAGTFEPPMKFPVLPPWRVKEAGGCPLKAYPKPIRDALLKAVRAVERQCEGARKDMQRAELSAVK